MSKTNSPTYPFTFRVKLLEKGDYSTTRRVKKWAKEIDTASFLDPNKRSNDAEIENEGLQSICSSLKSVCQEKKQVIDHEEEKDAAERRVLRRQRQKEISRMRGKIKGDLVVQDRSRSKAARVRQEGRRKKRKLEVEMSSSSDEWDIVIGHGSHHKGTEEHHTQPLQKRKSFVSLLDQCRFDDNSRGRIVLPQSNKGILGKGVSSKQHKQSDKWTTRQKSRLINNEKTNDLQSASVSTSSDEEEEEVEDPAIATINPIDNERRERYLKDHLLGRKKTDNKILNDEKEVLSADSIDNHSAFSVAQRLKTARQVVEANAEKASGGVQEGPVTSQLQHNQQASSSPLPNLPPPLLAFDGNRPHQHPNAWRGQHNRHEQDWREIRESLEAADLRASRPLEHIIAELGQANRDTIAEWEVLPAGEVCDYKEDRYRDQSWLDFYTRRQHYPEAEQQESMSLDLAEETEWQREEGQEEESRRREDNAWHHQQQQHQQHDQQQQQQQRPSLNEQDECMAEYLDYSQEGEVDTGDPQRHHTNPETEWFDQDAYQQEDLWFDQVSQVDQFESGEIAVTNIRAAIQPTAQDLHNFWKPQPH